MKCYNCKKEIQDDSPNCPKCGAPQQFTEELVRSAEYDQEAFQQLYYMTKDNVYYTIKSLIQDEDTAQDLTQDTYVKAVGSLPQLKDAAAFRGWIKMIARNLAIDSLRKNKNKTVAFSEMVSADSDEEIDFEDDRIESMPEEVADRAETTRLIEEILGTLPEEQRLTVVMHYMQQMSVREIAEAFGVSENTVKSRLNYGRKKVEEEVLKLEKKGTKLYGLAPMPFLGWLLRSQEAYTAALPDAQILQAAAEAAKGTAAATAAQGTATAAKGAASSTAKSVASAVVKGAAAKGTTAISVKLVVGIIAAAVAVSGGVGYLLHRQNRPAPEVPSVVSSAMEESSTAPVETQTLSETPSEVSSEVSEPEEPKIDPSEAYQAIIDEYAALYAMDDETYLSNPTAFGENIRHTMMLRNYHSYRQDENYMTYSFGRSWYAYADINGDGNDELLLGGGEYAGADSFGIHVEDIFYFDGTSAKWVLDEPGIQVDVNSYRDFTVFENGSVLAYWIVPGTSHYIEGLLQFDGTGWHPVVAYRYMSQSDSGKVYTNDSEELTFEEYMAVLQGYGVDYFDSRVYDFDWQPIPLP